MFDPPLRGDDDAEAKRLANTLGVALQLTNILRDIREDLAAGRVYLPTRDLELFGVELRTADDGSLDPQDGRLAELIRFEAARAAGRYDEGLRLLPMLDWRSAACAGAMAGIYRELLARIAADPTIVMRGRAALPTRDKLWVAIRAMARRSCAWVPARSLSEAGSRGIAAALRLADAGATVQLVEGRPRLGGAAFSFRRGDLSVDNGQHVFLRCCEAYRELVRRLDGENNVVLQPRLSIPILAPGGRSAKLSRLPGVPAPLHLSAALAGYRLLSVTERARAVAGALALRRLDPANAALDAQTLGAFLRDHGQTDAIITALWGVVGTATLNLDPNEASLALAAKVFRTGLLDHAPASDVGYAATPLGALHSDAAAQALDAAGVEVLLAHRAERVQPVDAGMSVAARRSRRYPPASRRRGCSRRTALRGISGGTGSRRDAGCRGGGPRLQRDRQRACHLRPPGHRLAVRRRGSLAGAMVLRPHGYVRAQGGAVPGGYGVGS